MPGRVKGESSQDIHSNIRQVMDTMKRGAHPGSNEKASNEVISDSNDDLANVQKKLEPKNTQSSHDEAIKYLQQDPFQKTSMQGTEISKGISNNIQPMLVSKIEMSIKASKENGAGLGCEKSIDENEPSKSGIDANLIANGDQETTSAMSNICTSQETVPMSGSVEYITTHVEGCMVSDSSKKQENHPIKLGREVYPNYATSLEQQQEAVINKEQTRSCKQSNPWKRTEQSEYDLSLAASFYSFLVRKLKNSEKIYNACVANEERIMRQHELHDTMALKSKNEPSQGATCNIKENNEVKNNDLKQESQGEATSHTNIQSNTLKTFPYLLKPCELSERNNVVETIHYKETETHKLAEHRKCTKCNLDIFIKYYDIHINTCKNDKQISSAPVKNEPSKEMCQQELIMTPAFNSNNVQYQVGKETINVEESKMQQERQAWEATGARPREKDWKKKYFTCNKTNKGDPFGPAINYENLTLQEKSELLTQICGVVSNISGRPCKRSVRCPWHLDEERNALRISLLSVPASDAKPNQAVSPGIPNTNNVTVAEDTVNDPSDASSGKSSEHE